MHSIKTQEESILEFLHPIYLKVRLLLSMPELRHLTIYIINDTRFMRFGVSF